MSLNWWFTGDSKGFFPGGMGTPHWLHQNIQGTVDGHLWSAFANPRQLGHL